MSFLLPCPNCGPRDVNEFVYAGEVSVRPQQEPSLAELVAVALAEAAPRAGARLVEINLAATTHGPHRERARRAVREATDALLQTAGDE